MATKKSKKSILSRIRNYFITGILVLIPIGITLYLTIFLIKISYKLIPKEINPDRFLPYEIPGLEILIALFLITFIGWLSLTFIGKRLVLILEGILNKIPILRTIYSSAEQLIDNFSQDKKNKKSVVLVQYPRQGIWAVGFATKENTGKIKNAIGQDTINVFVPTTPNPTSGFLLMFPKNDVIYLDLTFEEASKFIVSAGSINP
ncbi:MAG: hypothetical protein CMG67_00975 [Candidatus Marinimicrobia bacterium]|mgnify:CR=1 FL=1|nr:hypothetical protein [Candidatus Neomarinimicrobiota bacterium]|tara:strand:- start:11771 stop:12382 length:612 start_codon:yes stop_codon:yes gene_type:complete